MKMNDESKLCHENKIMNREDLIDKIKSIKKESKISKLKLKKEYCLDIIKGERHTDNLEYSINYYKDLNKECLNNYKLLLDYSTYCENNNDKSNKLILESLNDYCNKFYNYTKSLYNDIMNRNCNNALIVSLINNDEIMDPFKANNEDLINHVSQIVDLKVKKNIK